MTARRLLALTLLLGLAGCGGTTFDPGANQIEAAPPPPSTSVATLGGQTYSVVAGDTVDSLAKQFGVPVDVLIQANGLTYPYELRPGQQLVVPVSGSYVVAPGDSLYRIAKRHGTTVAALADMNGIAPPYTIRVGQHLILPGGALDSAGAAQGGTMTLPPTTPGAALPGAGSSKVTTEALLPPPGATSAPAPGATTSTSSTMTTVLPPPPLPPVNPTAPPPPTPAPTGESNGSAPALAPIAPAPAAIASIPAPAATASVPPAPSTVNPGPAGSGSSQTAAIQPQAVGRGSGKFMWPVNGKIVSPFGPKDGGSHNDGINIAAPLGTPVRAADSGVVVYAGNELRGFGNLLLIRHADGWVSAYAHCDALLVKRGEQVKRGQVIGRVGQSGNVTAPQLHFELRKGAEAVDPLSQLGPQGA